MCRCRYQNISTKMNLLLLLLNIIIFILLIVLKIRAWILWPFLYWYHIVSIISYTIKFMKKKKYIFWRRYKVWGRSPFIGFISVQLRETKMHTKNKEKKRSTSKKKKEIKGEIRTKKKKNRMKEKALFKI